MAATNKTPIAVIRKEYQNLLDENEKLKHDSGYCRLCDRILNKNKFYTSTDPLAKGGITPVCKECARKIALRVDADGHEHQPTKDSIISALRYLDKPFLETVYNASIQESQNESTGKTKSDPWMAYVKNIAMKQYVGWTFLHSDFYHQKILYDDEKTEQQLVEEHAGQDTYDAFLKNKNDVIRLLDYDPFEKELVSDQPFLYSQLLGMLDASEEGNDDMIRISSAVIIARGFLQESKIDNAITMLMGDIQNVSDNSATIKSLQDSKQKITSMITNLAKESCLSLANSRTNHKGDNSWTGKLKKIRELDLREYEINGFDIETCKGMQQVADISVGAILKNLEISEDEWSTMVAQQTKLISELRNKTKSYEEACRILLRENLDLRDTMRDKGILDERNLIDLNKIVETYIVHGDEYTDST